MIAKLRTAAAAIHVPSAITSAIVTVIGLVSFQVYFGGQPVDLSSAAGRGTFLVLLIGVLARLLTSPSDGTP